MTEDKLSTHDRAVQAVEEQLTLRGFDFDSPRVRSGETIRIKARNGTALSLQVKVHGDTQGNPWILARHAGVPVDPSYYVVLVNIRQYYLPQFYVLTNAEAHARYVLDQRNVAHYDLEGLVPDAEGFEKIGK